MPIITITDLPGTGGEEIASRLSLKLGIPLYNKSDTWRHALEGISTKYDIKLLNESPKNFKRNAQNGKSFQENISKGLNSLADTSNAVVLGIVPGLFLAKHPNAIHVHVTAPEELRKRRLLKLSANSQEVVSELMRDADREFKRFGKILFDEKSQDPFLYHITINTGKVSVDAAVLMIAELFKDHMAKQVLFNSASEDDRIKHREAASTEMKNQSELDFSKVLDMYHIRWIYEPKTFALTYDGAGRMSQAFSPDFYLPDYDIYLELTIMNPKYSTEKKQKIKLLEELYPGTKVKLVQKKDFEHFLRSLKRASTILLSTKSKKKNKQDEIED